MICMHIIIILILVYMKYHTWYCIYTGFIVGLGGRAGLVNRVIGNVFGVRVWVWCVG